MEGSGRVGVRLFGHKRILVLPRATPRVGGEESDPQADRRGQNSAPFAGPNVGARRGPTLRDYRGPPPTDKAGNLAMTCSSTYRTARDSVRAATMSLLRQNVLDRSEIHRMGRDSADLTRHHTRSDEPLCKGTPLHDTRGFPQR